MAKFCVLCGEKAGLLSGTKIKDGVVCMGCLNRSGIPSNSLTKSMQDFNNRFQYLEDNKNLFNSFNATINIPSHLEVDEKNRLFKIGKCKECFYFSDLINFELVEDGETIVKGGLGRAVVGGILFGGVGAIVGGATGGKKSKTLVNSMYIRISLNNNWVNSAQITLINSETKKGSFLYNISKDSANKIISALELISSVQEKTPAQTVTITAQVDTTEEIQKYHDLMVKGIISEEDFNAKKRVLLGI